MEKVMFADKRNLLEKQIQETEAKLAQLRVELKELKCDQENASTVHLPSSENNKLNNDDIARYSRQIILPHFGVAGQLKLKNSSCLIVGIGGLGCPAAQYLIAAGCGTLGLVDYDDVEASNFHRQILHNTASIGCSKVDSAARTLLAMNPNCKIQQYNLLLNSENAMEIIQAYDVVLDCTDNVATRYLLNDACVFLHKPLVSGSALQMDGQLTVYNYGDTCPCYRCIFPVPPPPETVTNCGDGGVLGPVPGVIGVMQALEAIKIVVNDIGETVGGRLMLFDATNCQVRNIKLRGRRKDCAVCSENPTITSLIDYEQFCGMRASDKDAGLNLLTPEQRITVEKYSTLKNGPHLLIDVRQPAEFEICALSGAENIPLKKILDNSFETSLNAHLANEQLPIIVLCRRGNDSQLAVQHMSERYPQRRLIYDIEGGLHAWHQRVDNSFPIY